jgi:hypothetical protein
VLKSLPKPGFGACLCTTGQLTYAEIVDKAGKRRRAGIAPQSVPVLIPPLSRAFSRIHIIEKYRVYRVIHRKCLYTVNIVLYINKNIRTNLLTTFPQKQSSAGKTKP